MDFKFKKDDFQTKIQQNIDDLRTRQAKRDKTLKRLEKIKEQIKSVEELNKLWL